MYCIDFVLAVLELITRALGYCTEIASKRQKLLIYRHFLSQFEAFSITNCYYFSSPNESTLKRGVLPLFGEF